jgi:hypothetical protein
MPDYVPEKFEPIKNIEFETEQKWPHGESIKKIKIEFPEEEDMMLLILNIFVHDFGHDYNFLGDSYLRRIVSNIKELELLGIENGKKTLKKLTDIISSEPRIPSMYNDNIFEDVEDPSYLSPDLKTRKQKFNERLNGFEIATAEQLANYLNTVDGGDPQAAAQNQSTVRTRDDIYEQDKPLLESREKDRIVPEISVVSQQLEAGVEDLGTGVKEESATDHYSIVVPPLSGLRVDISEYIKVRANDPESLEMLSTLKLYITSYLGPNYYTGLIPETVAPTSEAFYKYYTHYSVITTFYGLICYYDDIVEENIFDEQLSILTILFSDLLLILLASYLEFVNREGEDYFSREDALDPLTILDSTQVMANYNRLFAEYVQASDSEFDNFKIELMSQFELEEDSEHVKLEGGGVKFNPFDANFEPTVSSAQDELPKYKHTYVKRQYGVFHNNLLTTVARGIFLKTGIWQKIYPPALGEKAIDFPSQFVYNEASPKDVSQQFEEWKTTDLSLITNITRDSLKASGFKNDLLIAEILILKHMLIEILPDFLYLANGIDDKLRNFLEVYLYTCGNYDAALKPLSSEDQAILYFETEKEAKEEDLKFIVGDGEEPNIEEFSGGSNMKGGVNFSAKSDGRYEDDNFGFSKRAEPVVTPVVTPVRVVPIVQVKSPEEKKREKMQLSKEDVERAFRLNNDVIRNLTESGIPPFDLEGTEITNLFDLLKLNLGMITRKDSDFAFPAPKRKFILDNASTLTRNVNGLKLFHDKNALEDLERTLSREEYDKLLKEFRAAQKFFGLYKTLKRGVVCAGSSMLDAMDNCSLDKGATEPKEVGTTNFEFVFDDPLNGKHLSYGGVVLFYKGKNKDWEDNINVHIDFSLKTKLSRDEPDDVAHVVVDELDVADSEDLKARVVYKSVIKEVNKLFKEAFAFEEVPDLEGDQLDPEFIKKNRELSIKKMRFLWSFLQYNPYLQTNPVFNKLLGKTSIKNLGDFLQESQGTIKWGGYVNTIDDMDDAVKEFINEKGINVDEDIIWRSVSKKNAIIPYDENGDALRLAVEGDRPSAFRAIYFVLFALTKNSTEGINSMTIAGYLNGLRSILVSRNLPYIDVIPQPIPPELVGSESLEEEKEKEKEDEEKDEEVLVVEESKMPEEPSPLTLESLQMIPSPIPYGKVIYVNSEAKNINVKATIIKDPQIKRPKTLEELEKKLTEVKPKTKKPKAEPLAGEQLEVAKLKLKRDRKDLINQVNFRNSIPTISELKKLTEEAERAQLFAVLPGHSQGGKTRKHKKPLKKKTNTRNKNKTKKAKKSKKTIKRRKVIKKKHQKTR